MEFALLFFLHTVCNGHCPEFSIWNNILTVVFAMFNFNHSHPYIPLTSSSFLPVHPVSSLHSALNHLYSAAPMVILSLHCCSALTSQFHVLVMVNYELNYNALQIEICTILCCCSHNSRRVLSYIAVTAWSDRSCSYLPFSHRLKGLYLPHANAFV